MEVPEILEALERYTGEFPREALREAVAHREKITPELLRILAEDAARVEDLDPESDYNAYTWAMYLLAQFREAHAYPLIIEFFSKPGEAAKDLTGDLVTEDLPRIIASVYDGNTRPIESLIENPELDEFVRTAGLGALVTLVATGQKPREEVIAYFRRLFHLGFAPEDRIWTWLVDTASDLSPHELMPEIEAAFDEGRVDTMVLGLDWVEESVDRGWDVALGQLRHDRHHQLVDDVEKETEWWACWQPREAPRPAPKPPAPAPTPAPQGRSASLDTYVRPSRKVGRNEPCPCGSGKKYKKCCGR